MTINVSEWHAGQLFRVRHWKQQPPSNVSVYLLNFTASPPRTLLVRFSESRQKVGWTCRQQCHSKRWLICTRLHGVKFKWWAAIAYAVRAGWSGLRNPTEARGFSHPQTPQNGSGALGYRWLFPGVRRLGREIDHSPASDAEIKNECNRLYGSAPFVFITATNRTYLV